MLFLGLQGKDGMDIGPLERKQRRRSNGFSLEQKSQLWEHFCANDRPNYEQKLKIAQEVGLTPRQVINYFQNTRGRMIRRDREL